ncbi:MAG: hypothetical protein HQ461_05790 [Deltaproteobacteria bacterium]|jgi:hypothetical protein|nr:hypothetical protein [Deltaproteobacteria bacterium]
MATKRPAKLAIGKKVQVTKLDPISGKPMTPVKMIRRSGSSGMHWVVLEEFDGTDKAIERALPIR